MEVKEYFHPADAAAKNFNLNLVFSFYDRKVQTFPLFLQTFLDFPPLFSKCVVPYFDRKVETFPLFLQTFLDFPPISQVCGSILR